MPHPSRPRAAGVAATWDGFAALAPEAILAVQDAPLRDREAGLSDALVRIPTIRTARAHAAAGGRTWLYDLAWSSPGLGAGHGLDIPLIFGSAATGYAGRFLGTPPPAVFEPLSRRIRDAWTGFAATADPGWPQFDLTHHRTRIWDAPPRDAEDPLADSRRIWQTVPGGDDHREQPH